MQGGRKVVLQGVGHLPYPILPAPAPEALTGIGTKKDKAGDKLPPCHLCCSAHISVKMAQIKEFISGESGTKYLSTECFLSSCSKREKGLCPDDNISLGKGAV